MGGLVRAKYLMDIWTVPPGRQFGTLHKAFLKIPPYSYIDPNMKR